MDIVANNVEESIRPVPTTSTPEPLTETKDSESKFVPLNTTGTVSPRKPEFGVIDDKMGNGFMANGIVPLVPFEVETASVRVPVVAAESMVIVTIAAVELRTVTELPVTPVPLTTTDVDPEAKFVPIKNTVSLVPTMPRSGLTRLIVGAVDEITLNVTVPLVPAPVTTVTV